MAYVLCCINTVYMCKVMFFNKDIICQILSGFEVPDIVWS